MMKNATNGKEWERKELGRKKGGGKKARGKIWTANNASGKGNPRGFHYETMANATEKQHKSKNDRGEKRKEKKELSAGNGRCQVPRLSKCRGMVNWERILLLGGGKQTPPEPTRFKYRKIVNQKEHQRLGGEIETTNIE